MKIELNEQSKLALVAVAVIWAIVFLAVSISSHYTERTKSAFAAGLEENSVPGQAGVHWVKPRQ